MEFLFCLSNISISCFTPTMMILRLVSTSPGIDKVISLSLRSSVQNVNYQTDQQPPYPLARGSFAFYSFSARSRNAYHKVEILGKAYTEA